MNVNRNLIVGDIHGHYDKLMAALEAAGFSDSDTLYSVGDLFDRGLENLKVFQFCKSLGNRFKPVFGNHDIYSFQYLKDDLDELTRLTWFHNGGGTTLHEFSQLSTEEKQDILNWLGNFMYVRNVDGARILHTTAYLDTWDNFDIEFLTLKGSIDSGFVRDTAFDGYVFDREIFTKGLQEEPLPEGSYFNSSSPLTIIGHTCMRNGKATYIPSINCINIDTGVFTKGGCLTVMDINSLECFNSKRDSYVLDI